MAYLKPQSPIKYKEDHIYPLTTIDQIIMEDGQRLNAVGIYLEKPDENEDTTVEGVNADTLGGKLASEYILKDETVENAINANLLGGKEPKYYLQPRNLLNNSWFGGGLVNGVKQELVNQRGYISGKQGQHNYCIDRWKLQYDTYLHLHDGYIGISGYWEIQQLLACKIEAGKTYTFAVLAKGETGAERVAVGVDLDGINVITNRFKNIGTDWNVYCATFIADKDYDAGKCKCVVGINDGNDQTTQTLVRWAVVYEGAYTADNLPPYVPKGYAAELAECQRYYEKIRNGCSEVVRPYQATTMAFTLVYSEKRIANPTITFGNTSNCISIYGVGSYTPTSISSAYPIGVKSSRINCIGEYDTAKTCSMDFAVCNVEISADL